MMKQAGQTGASVVNLALVSTVCIGLMSSKLLCHCFSLLFG